MILHRSSFEGGEAVAPVLWQWCWLACFGVEVDHHLRADAFHLIGEGVLQDLQHSEALVAHVVDLSLHHQGLVK